MLFSAEESKIYYQVSRLKTFTAVLKKIKTLGIVIYHKMKILSDKYCVLLHIFILV
jgi:hypothetical protein